MKKNQSFDNLIEKKYGNTGGIIVKHNGSVILEKYYNGQNRNTKNHIFSATKSIVSILIGIAIDKGYIKSENQEVLHFFPNFKPSKQNTSAEKVTIRDIITMTAPYSYIFPNYKKYFMSFDYLSFSLHFLGNRKMLLHGVNGESNCKFMYAGIIGPDILSGILQNATGKSVLDFANEVLFKPLTIDVNNSIVFSSKKEQFAFYKEGNKNGWVADTHKINPAGWGLNLTAAEMSKIAELYANNGYYNGTQIVSSDWVKKSTMPQSYCNRFKLSYGYLWWILDDESYAAMGDGGNILYVNKSKNITIALTGIFVPNARLRIDLIKNILEPMCS